MTFEVARPRKTFRQSIQELVWMGEDDHEYTALPMTLLRDLLPVSEDKLKNIFAIWKMQNTYFLKRRLNAKPFGSTEIQYLSHDKDRQGYVWSTYVSYENLVKWSLDQIEQNFRFPGELVL